MITSGKHSMQLSIFTGVDIPENLPQSQMLREIQKDMAQFAVKDYQEKASSV